MNISKLGRYLAGNGATVASLWLRPPFLFVHARACHLFIGSRTFGALACRLIQNKTAAFGGECGDRTQWVMFAKSLTVATNEPRFPNVHRFCSQWFNLAPPLSWQAFTSRTQHRLTTCNAEFLSPCSLRTDRRASPRCRNRQKVNFGFDRRIFPVSHCASSFSRYRAVCLKAETMWIQHKAPLERCTCRKGMTVPDGTCQVNKDGVRTFGGLASKEICLRSRGRKAGHPCNR